MSRSFNLLCEEVLQEWLGQRKKFKAIFDSSKHADPVKSFHEKCNSCGPNVTVFHYKDNSIIGAFTSEEWKPPEVMPFKTDNKAFLFIIFNRGGFQPRQYPVEDDRFAVFCSKDCGPAFGGNMDRRALEIKRNPRKQNAGEENVHVSYNSIDNTFKMDIESKRVFERALRDMTKFEVFQLLEDDTYIEREWRPLPDVSVEHLKNELVQARPNHAKEDHFKLLLVGQIGAGKSSFINSVKSPFKGYVSSSICTGSDRTSLTLENTEHVIRNHQDNSQLNFRIWDTKGLEPKTLKIQERNIIDTIKGQSPTMMKRVWTYLVSKYWQTPRTSQVNLNKFNCVAFVVDGTSVDKLSDKMRDTINNIRRLSNKLRVPQVVLLTKIDEVCPMVHQHPALTFHSKAVSDQVDLTAELLGMPRNNVLPVKNYESEFELDPAIDRLTLLSVRHMIRLATDIMDDFDV